MARRHARAKRTFVRRDLRPHNLARDLNRIGGALSANDGGSNVAQRFAVGSFERADCKSVIMRPGPSGITMTTPRRAHHRRASPVRNSPRPSNRIAQGGGSSISILSLIRSAAGPCSDVESAAPDAQGCICAQNNDVTCDSRHGPRPPEMSLARRARGSSVIVLHGKIFIKTIPLEWPLVRRSPRHFRRIQDQSNPAYTSRTAFRPAPDFQRE